MTEEPGGANGVRAMFDQAEEFAPDPEDPGADPAGEGAPRRQKGPPWSLPDDAPVTPLGIAGDVHFYLDATQQLRMLKAKDHSRLNVQSLFGTRTPFLYNTWPRLKQDKDTGKWFLTGWMPEAVAEALMRACARRGAWDVMGRVRGAGGWREEDGRLAFHCGDAIWLGSDEVRKPGLDLSRTFVYPGGPAAPRPAETPQPGGEAGPAWRLLELLKSWAWKRGETDAILLLGWIGAAFLGGALAWRPLAWITGGAATGKSTLHDVIRAVIPGILSSSDATAAGIWQVLGHSSMPVAIDELEARDDNRRAQAVVELARQAASGGVLFRGGADHQGSQFTARSCFLFSSILIPPLLTQDVSRMAILELGRLDTTTPPALAGDRLALGAIGRGLMRRLADGWHRWPATLEAYRQQLAAAGHNGRGADQFGTLLAAADVLLHDGAPDREADDEDRLSGWTARLSAEALRAQSDDAPDEDRCLAHLLSTPADVWRGGVKLPIARYVRRCAGLDNEEGGLELGPAQDTLSNLGLRVERVRLASGVEEHCLVVANTHQGLSKVFEGSQWGGRAGATGGWRQSLLRLEGARPLSDYVDAKGRGRVTLSFGGVACRAVCVPIAAATGGEEG